MQHMCQCFCNSDKIVFNKLGMLQIDAVDFHSYDTSMQKIV